MAMWTGWILRSSSTIHFDQTNYRELLLNSEDPIVVQKTDVVDKILQKNSRFFMGFHGLDVLQLSCVTGVAARSRG